MSLTGREALPAALYVHVPFCRARCTYCDFNTYAGLERLQTDYVSALCQEIERSGKTLGHPPAATIYFGGGTPSTLPLDDVGAVLSALRCAFALAPQPETVETTLECNPGTLDARYLLGLRTSGVNRLSLGAQSADAGELRMLGRIHTWPQVVEAVRLARAAGFDNLNLDLIYGLPGQGLDRWRRSLEAALALQPEHLSLYSLTLEEGTSLARQVAVGEQPEPDPDLAADMLELAEEMLQVAGYTHYEISNWARARVEDESPYVARHNLAYWRNRPWLGFGAGAHSWWGGERRANLAHPRDYVDAVVRGVSPVAERETIPPQLEMGETMMLGLRLSEGVGAAGFAARFGCSLEAVYGAELRDLARLGLVEWDGAVVRLTARGRHLGNQVFARFLPG